MTRVPLILNRDALGAHPDAVARVARALLDAGVHADVAGAGG